MNIRILSYNIHKCIGGLDRRYRPDRISEIISHYQPHIAMLQEVDNGVKRSSGHCQIELLAESIGYNYHSWYPNVKVRGGGTYGNGILSRFPLLDNHNINITTPPKKCRSVLYARQQIPYFQNGTQHLRTLHLFNMHLGLSQTERKIQLRKFMECHPFRGLHRNTPIIVAGDLNDVYGNLGSQILGPQGFQTRKSPKATFPAYAPLRALDGFYVRGPISLVSVERSRLAVAKTASDHLPIVADLTLNSE